MVSSVTGLGRSGLVDWVVQRVSAVVLTAYTAVLLVFLIGCPDVSFDTWSQLFSQLWMRIFSLIALLSTIAHAWIGLWAVLTDYITNRLMGPKATVLRGLILSVYAVVCVTMLVWGVEILWGFNR